MAPQKEAGSRSRASCAATPGIPVALTLCRPHDQDQLDKTRADSALLSQTQWNKPPFGGISV